MVDVPLRNRTHDLKKPPGHKVAVPRWTLKFPPHVTHTYTLYIGAQARPGANSTAVQNLEQKIEKLLHDANPEALDTFRVTEGFDLAGTRVWVAYWTDSGPFRAALDGIDLGALWRGIEDERDREAVGVWVERFTTPLEKLETNYARLEHRPGLAGIEGCEMPGHELTGYWGAGRDRIPASAEDQFEPAAAADHDEMTNGTTNGAKEVPRGVGQRITGTNYDNMCHIRSGQYWQTCPPAETEAYESSLEPALMEGMRYLWDNAAETGTLGLRFLQNLSPSSGDPIKETCGAGFHRNWADLELWSSRHPSHLKIFNGAMRHAKQFGEDRKFMTWHEVSILKSGEVGFEYVNCVPETGVVKWVKGLEVVGL